MSDAKKRPRAELLPIAEELAGLLATACERIEIAGSLRRQTREVGDIELVAIPAIEDLVETGEPDVFGKRSETVTKFNRLWAALDGFFKPTSGRLARGTYIREGDKYRCFSWPTRSPANPDFGPVKVDLFTATPRNWGWIYLLRTGSETFSHYVAGKLNVAGYTSNEGEIYRGERDPDTGKMKPLGSPLETTTEQRVFDLARIPFRKPEQRA